LTALIIATVLIGTPGPAQAGETKAGETKAGQTTAGATAAPAATGSTPVTVRRETTEHIRAMAATGTGRLFTLGGPAAQAQSSPTGVAAAAVVYCYLDMSSPYGGGPGNAHVYLDGVVYCDDYFHLGVLTVELFRGADRVANKTVTAAYLYGMFGTADYSACSDGVYTGVVGVTVFRSDFSPQSASATIVGFPVFVSCPPPPPPPPASPLAVTTPATQQTIEDVWVSLQLTATGGTSPYTWSATGLPRALSINAGTGLISGNTTGLGRYTVTVTATDAAGRVASTQFTWVIKHDGCARC
jgi:hypothetical protein